jgi:hypothetical protein
MALPSMDAAFPSLHLVFLAALVFGVGWLAWLARMSDRD